MNSSILNNGICLQDWKETIRKVADVKKRFAMLENNLYSITDRSVVHYPEIIYRVRFHPECEIYKVHFPSQPMTPGACLLEIAKELIENYKSKKLSLRLANSIRYLNPIDPRENESVDFILTFKDQDEDLLPGTFKVNVLIKNEKASFAKMNLLLEM